MNKAQASPSGYSFIISEVKDVDSSAMRNMWDVVQARVTGPVAAVFAAKHSGKAVLLAAGNDEAVAAGFNAGEVIKTIAPKVKGGGGGKPAMAQAGGKDANGIVDALQAAREMLL